RASFCAVAIPPGDAVASVPASGASRARRQPIGRSGMRFLARRWSVAGMVVAVACALSIAAWAGGAGFGDDDDNSEEEGPSYFGFVRDASGATISDAKVTVGVKNRGGVVTRTDLLGTYKVPGFGNAVDPKDVEVSCV